MKTWNINKGIGCTVEFKGLKAQYLFGFAGGLLLVLILVMVLYMADVNTYICLSIGFMSASLIIWKTFSLNNKYGEHGLMKLGAKRKHPRYIISRQPVQSYLKSSAAKGEKTQNFNTKS
ncbi:DUF4133 domain-containing protein [Chryseobacterium arthrosphaerae]|uniref:DUF4133 domain-containing protein n=1 Tax=Chryseobacterium arthrosphaerae TaxID=651561 RepID=A0ABU7QU08_9FLAO|nr:DUF4133 domain-containing protein [Chryseobacterium sp. AG363]RKE80793.1 uncharacterized protein DUF4133 [Chryseobacterium sp. AG363]